MQAIITTGGTGITSRDSTFEVVNALLEKRLDGFGELFRMLSYEQIGSGGDHEPRDRRAGRRPIVAALPGSEAAVRLASNACCCPSSATWSSKRAR